MTFVSSRRSSNKPSTVSSIDVVEVPAAFFAVQMYRPSSSLTTPVRLKTPAECRTGMSLHGDRAFTVHAPREWNLIPYEIRKSNTISSFKRSLKTYLFTKFSDNRSLFL